MKVLLGIQARTASSRLPGKIYQSIGPKSLLHWVYDAALEAERKLRAAQIDAVTYVLGPEGDDELASFCQKNLLKYLSPAFTDENDLLHRYLKAAKHLDCNYITRLTSDCWQMNPHLLAEAVSLLSKVDYVSNTVHRSFMEGLDIQGCSLKALHWFDHEQKEKREHPFFDFDQNLHVREAFEKCGFKYTEFLNPQASWTIRTSIDTEEDLKKARSIYDEGQKSRSDLDRAQQERPRAGISGH